MTLPPLFILEEPHYHRIRFGEKNRFRGVALALDGPEIDSVAIYRDGQLVAEANVDRDCPELAGFVRLPRAATSRFMVDLVVERGEPYEIRGRSLSGEKPLFLFDVPLAEREWERLQRLHREVSAYPRPSGAVIEMTQGGTNAEAYLDGIVSGVMAEQMVLHETGVDASEIRDLLDIGSGTGRLLLGWYCDDASRRLVGVDINSELIAWSRQHLRGIAEWGESSLYPPLRFPDDSFDLIHLVSVFTHLPLPCQRQWLREIKRLLRPSGTAVFTLHGDLYAALLLDPTSRETFARAGHLEVPGGAEGANSYSTFHAPAFARSLFSDFRDVRHFPRGQSGAARLFPFGSMQDVWVMRK